MKTAIAALIGLAFAAAASSALAQSSTPGGPPPKPNKVATVPPPPPPPGGPGKYTAGTRPPGGEPDWKEPRGSSVVDDLAGGPRPVVEAKKVKCYGECSAFKTLCGAAGGALGTANDGGTICVLPD